MKHYLVIGGAGFIGSNLASALVKREDCAITIVDDLSLGKIDNIRELLQGKNVRFVRADMGKRSSAQRIFRKYGPFDTVFHMAANSDIQKSAKDPGIEYRNTFMTTREVLEAMRLFGCKEVLFCSTSAIYGDKGASLIAEASGPYLPISYYGGAKLASEGFIAAYSHMNDMKATILRFPNVVGDNATHGVILDFVRKLLKNPSELEILGDGSQEKSYLFVADLVDAILFLQSNRKEAIEVFNIGAEGATSVKDIASIVIEEMGLTNVRLRYTGGSIGWKGDVPKFQYCLDKVHAAGWTATHSSNEAVRLAAKRIIEECRR